MNNEQQRTYDQAQVMLAFARGEKIEYKWLGKGQWVVGQPLWDWVEFDYRIAPLAKKKVKLCAWIDSGGELRWFRDAFTPTKSERRVPSEDKEVEVEG